MIEISKRSIIFLIIAALLLGSAGTILILRGGAGGSVLVDLERYEKMSALEDEYEKMDEIKQAIWERWEAMKADFDDFRERWKEKIEAWASEKWDAVINAMQPLNILV